MINNVCLSQCQISWTFHLCMLSSLIFEYILSVTNFVSGLDTFKFKKCAFKIIILNIKKKNLTSNFKSNTCHLIKEVVNDVITTCFIKVFNKGDDYECQRWNLFYNTILAVSYENPSKKNLHIFPKTCQIAELLSTYHRVLTTNNI